MLLNASRDDGLSYWSKHENMILNELSIRNDKIAVLLVFRLTFLHFNW